MGRALPWATLSGRRRQRRRPTMLTIIGWHFCWNNWNNWNERTTRRIQRGGLLFFSFWPWRIGWIWWCLLVTWLFLVQMPPHTCPFLILTNHSTGSFRCFSLTSQTQRLIGFASCFTIGCKSCTLMMTKWKKMYCLVWRKWYHLTCARAHAHSPVCLVWFLTCAHAHATMHNRPYYVYEFQVFHSTHWRTSRSICGQLYGRKCTGIGSLVVLMWSTTTISEHVWWQSQIDIDCVPVVFGRDVGRRLYSIAVGCSIVHSIGIIDYTMWCQFLVQSVVCSIWSTNGHTNVETSIGIGRLVTVRRVGGYSRVGWWWSRWWWKLVPGLISVGLVPSLQKDGVEIQLISSPLFIIRLVIEVVSPHHPNESYLLLALDPTTTHNLKRVWNCTLVQASSQLAIFYIVGGRWHPNHDVEKICYLSFYAAIGKVGADPHLRYF